MTRALFSLSNGFMTASIAGALLALAALPAGPALAQDRVEASEQAAFRVVTLARGLDHPWGMAFLPGGGILITERTGQLRLFKDGKLQTKAIPGAPQVAARGQGGLLDVALHPDFAENRLVYLSYAGAGPGGAGTEVARARFDGNKLDELEVIFRAEPKTPGGAHYGSRLTFDRSGRLYISLGDRRNYMREAQNPANHLGSIIRLEDDGEIPGDNPFLGVDGTRPEIFSYGHRNVQGLALNPASGEVWAHEHGPRGGDEVNILKAGANYGWPAITYGIDYSGAIISDKTEAPGMEQPVVYWVPSIAPSGMAFYDGDLFPQWKGDLFVGALAGRHLRRLELVGGEVTGQEELLTGLRERIRDVRSGRDGYLYLLTDSRNGRLIRLEPGSP
ncbi:PQQ-dependent sugar dehydrogenase [Pelagibius marinus]|uniref:PQQ-dependent sugar dehydrogenase n=1 Tax=Pelagibius marinus TaxID=2762760 RepID=UPI0029C9EF60|nr:PQQ-dependent sugar dehydrogenase [Pelagibius marinus]